MTPQEFTHISESDIIKLGATLLYNKKQLTNTNMECYIKGFQRAISMFKDCDIYDIIRYCVELAEKDLEDTKTAAAYRGGFYGTTPEDGKIIAEKENFLKKLKEVIE